MPRGPCCIMLAMLEPASRHALRATCTGFYRVPAAGTLCFPLDSPSALAACRARARATASGFLDRVPFWGASACCLSLRVLEHARCDSSETAKTLARACRALDVVFEATGLCPALVELHTKKAHWTSGPGLAPKLIAALNWLANSRFWPKADLSLREGEACVYAIVDEAALSSRLRDRLVWCDAVLTTTRHEGVPPFPVLRNACVTSDPECALFRDLDAFPAVRHVHLNTLSYDGCLSGRLAAVAGRLRSFAVNSHDRPRADTEPIAVGQQTKVQVLGWHDSDAFIHGGTLVSARVDSNVRPPPRPLLADEVTFQLLQTVPEFIDALSGVALPCRGARVTTYRLIAHEQLPEAVCIVRALGCCRRLTVSAPLVAPELLAALSPTVAHLVVAELLFLDEVGPLLRLLLRQRQLRVVTLETAVPVDIVDAYVQEARAGLQDPTAVPVVVSALGVWRMTSWSARPVHGHRVYAANVSAEAFRADVPDTPTEWSLQVTRLSLEPPLGPRFWAQFSRLARFFPNVLRLEVVETKMKLWRDAWAINALCACIGPGLRSFVASSITPYHRTLLACPWLLQSTGKGIGRWHLVRRFVLSGGHRR